MKKQLTAMILAVSAAFMGVSFGVFADVAPPQPSTVNIGKGNVSITPTHITYYKDSGNAVVPVTEPVNAAGYVITGTQVMQANGAPATTLQINGAKIPLTLKPTLLGTAFTVAGNLSTNAPLTFSGAVNVAGNLEAKSALLTNGTYSAVPVVFNGSVSVGGNLVADQTLTANGITTTTVMGDMTVGGQLTTQGPLDVKRNLTVAVPPVLKKTTVVANLTVNTGDFTVSEPVTGGTLQTNAGNLTINASTIVERVNASGNLTINASTTARNLSSGGDMTINVPVNTGSISAGGVLTSGNVLVQTTSGGITAKNAIDLGGPVTAAGAITSTAGNVTLRNSATATGAISGVNIELKGVTNAAAISATGGSLTADASVSTTGDMQATGNMLFRQTAKAGGNIRVLGAGNLTFNSVVDAGQLIATSQGSIYAQGDVRAWAVHAPGGTVDLRGNVTASNSVLAGSALSIAGAADTELISTVGAVTLGGNTTATTGVKGASVMVNNGAWLKTPNLNTPVTATNRFAVDVNTPFSAGTAVTVSATGVNAMPVTLGAARSTGLRLWLPAGRSNITVQDANRSYQGNVQVQASATPSYLTLSNNNSSAGGGGSGGVGGSDSFDEDEFWDDVVDRIKSARSGDEIRLSAAKVDNMPVWVLKELDGRNVTLRVSHGSVTVAMNGKKLPTIPANKVFYNFDDLKEWYVDGQKPEPSSSSQTSSAKPSTPLPPASSSAPQIVAPPASSVAPPKPSSSSSSEESSSALEEPSSSEETSSAEEVIADAEEDKTPPEPEKAKKPVLPLVIAGVVASLAAAGAVVGYLLYRHKSEEYLDDDKQDPPELPM